MYLSVKSIHSERLGWYNSARMTSFAKEWQFDYEKACSTLQSLRGTPSPAEWQVGRLAGMVDDLGERLAAMERRPVDYAVGQGELVRRRELLDALQHQVGAVRASPSGRDGMGTAAAGSGEGFGGRSGGGGDSISRLEQQRETMREHDRMLEELGRGVGRLKNQSTLINEETSLHVRLLDEMEGDAERASSGLRAEARHAEKIRVKGRTFNLYVIIAILALILVVLIFAGI